MQIGNIMKGASGWDNPSVGRVYDRKGLSPTLNSCTGGGRQPYIIVRCDSEKRIPIAIRGRNPGKSFGQNARNPDHTENRATTGKYLQYINDSQ